MAFPLRSGAGRRKNAKEIGKRCFGHRFVFGYGSRHRLDYARVSDFKGQLVHAEGKSCLEYHVRELTALAGGFRTPGRSMGEVGVKNEKSTFGDSRIAQRL